MLEAKILPLDLYEPLFKGDFYECDLWGGRSRGGSYAATQYALHKLLFADYYRGYFMRQVHSDIRDSLWADFKDRIEEFEDINQFSLSKKIMLHDSTMSALCVQNGNMIKSRGFKKSSNTRTANLKSLAGATDVIIEETEEVDYDDYLKLKESLRTTKAAIQIIRIFNPPHNEHWLWNDYQLTPHKNYEGFYTGMPKDKKNFVSIFGTYLDNYDNTNHETRKLFESYGQGTYRYNNTVLGLIPSKPEGVIYTNWEIGDFDSNHRIACGMDFGFKDPDVIVRVSVDKKRRLLYADEIYYKNNTGTEKLIESMPSIVSKKELIAADYEDSRTIYDISQQGFNIVNCKKDKLSERIKSIQDYKIIVTPNSVHLIEELKKYSWHDKKSETPIDDWNHCIDAMSYGFNELVYGSEFFVL